LKDAGDYLAYVKALAIASSQVTRCIVMREEVEGDSGLIRMRLTLSDGSILETFERFEIVDRNVQVTKYRFHWQDATGGLRKRWDNAPHHPELPTYPHHIHDGAEANAQPHKAINTEKVLLLIKSELSDTSLKSPS